MKTEDLINTSTLQTKEEQYSGTASITQTDTTVLRSLKTDGEAESTSSLESKMAIHSLKNNLCERLQKLESFKLKGILSALELEFPCTMPCQLRVFLI
jgi:hypothetical protein